MRPEKQLLLTDIENKIKQSKGFIVTRYLKLDSTLSTTFRTSLYHLGNEFEVVRKRVFLKALESTGFSIGSNVLEGHVGVVFASEDVLQATKAVFQFKSENAEVLEVIGGQFENQFYSAQEIEKLSKLPSKAEMQAQLLGVLEAVPSQTLAVFEALICSVCYCLDNKIKT